MYSNEKRVQSNGRTFYFMIGAKFIQHGGLFNQSIEIHSKSSFGMIQEVIEKYKIFGVSN